MFIWKCNNAEYTEYKSLCLWKVPTMYTNLTCLCLWACVLFSRVLTRTEECHCPVHLWNLFHQNSYQSLPATHTFLPWNIFIIIWKYYSNQSKSTAHMHVRLYMLNNVCSLCYYNTQEIQEDETSKTATRNMKWPSMTQHKSKINPLLISDCYCTLEKRCEKTKHERKR